jgi:DNA-binding NarL/FixJ family response regulator
MAQETKKKNIQTRSSGNQLAHNSASKLTNAQGLGKQIEIKLDHQAQSRSSNLPDQSASGISIGLIDKNSFTRECITKSMQELCKLFYITSFATCKECLQSTIKYDIVMYYAHESVTKRNNERKGGTSVGELPRMAPVVILADVDCVDAIITAFENGVRGYIPTATTTLELAIEIVRLVKAGGTFVPPSTLSLARVSRQGETG